MQSSGLPPRCPGHPSRWRARAAPTRPGARPWVRVESMRAWVNGHLLDAADAPALSVLDHGLTVGDGAFETIKTVAGEPFALTRHLRRLARSLTGLGITPPPEAMLRGAVEPRCWPPTT